MKIMTVFGTRPEGIKMAPLIHALKNVPSIECVVVNTAQHREMLDSVLTLFSITPDYDLNLMKQEQTPASLSSEMMQRLTEILDKEQPDLVLVHGDTTTTFLGAYCAFLKQIPVGHVEAGLRTYQIYEPFPEEMNRQLVGKLATWHFAATQKNKEALIKEQVQGEKIAVVGNTVIDALLNVANRPFSFEPALNAFLHNGKRTILLTTHRRENLDDLHEIYKGVNQLLAENNEVQVIFPLHKNPKVREQVRKHLTNSERVLLTEPLDYETFVHVMKASYFILTDSGGIQEEAPALGKPVLVARNVTERQEGVESGTLKLVGTSAAQIVTEGRKLLADQNYYEQIAQTKNPYGDGTASQQIIRFIQQQMD